MSNKTLEGMARTHYVAFSTHKPEYFIYNTTEADAMKAALLWLADNVTDEMVEALWADYHANNGSGRLMLSAALRAAAGSALEAKP